MTTAPRIFRQVTEHSDHIFLDEVGLPRDDKDTFFVMSPVAPHIKLFEELESQKRRAYATLQRVFGSDRLSDTGHFPLAHPLETMGAIFRFGDKSIHLILDISEQILSTSLGLSLHDCIIRPSNDSIDKIELLDWGISENSILHWRKESRLNLGEGRPSGKYIYFYLPYSNGVFPLFVLGIIRSNGCVNVDSAFFMERFQMVRERVDTPFETLAFRNQILSTARIRDLSYLSHIDYARWILFFRAVSWMLLDGTIVKGKGAGHILRKMIRELAWLSRARPPERKEVDELLNAVVADQKTFYDVKFCEGNILKVSEALYEHLHQAIHQINREIGRLQLSTRQIWTHEEVKRLSEERGLHYHWLRQLFSENNVPSSVPDSLQTRYSIRNHGYPYLRSAGFDASHFLKGAEIHR